MAQKQFEVASASRVLRLEPSCSSASQTSVTAAPTTLIYGFQRFGLGRSRVVLLVALVLATLSKASLAQNACVERFDSAKYGPSEPYVPAIPATAFDCHVQTPFGIYCQLKTDACSPKPECDHCPKKPATAPDASEPIDLSTGDVYITQTDFRLPGLGGGLALERTWNSIWPEKEVNNRIGLFGPNWRSTYEERILVGTDGYVKYSRSDGSFWSFGISTTVQTLPDGSPMYSPASPKNQMATLNQGPDVWTLVFQNGEQRTFDALTGFLLSITDRNGNVTRLSYDGAFRLVDVTDAASRHLTFSYASPTTYLITGASSSGISWSYSYDGQGRLVQVTKPDSTTVSFQYNDDSLITAVLDSNNKVLESHTYGSGGKGLTGARANGVEAVTVSYPEPATPPTTQ